MCALHLVAEERVKRSVKYCFVALNTPHPDSKILWHDENLETQPGPDGGVVGHVVVRREELDLGLAAVDDEHDVVDRHRSFSDVGRNDHLGHSFVDPAEHLRR